MALTTDIRIFPNKEMFAVDMAEVLDTAIAYNGIIQGCGITFNSTAGTLSIESGRMLIRGRLCIITESGDLAAPVVSGSTDVTCYLVASCNLSTANPFSVAIVTPGTYEEYQQLKEASADTFNTQDGFDFIVLGTATVSPSSGKVITWTPASNTNAKARNRLDSKKFGGTYLPAGSNIDSLPNEYSGWWGYKRSDVSGTFPVQDPYGTFLHVPGINSQVAMQMIRTTSQANTSPVIFMRFRTGNGWGAWQRFISGKLTQLTVTTIPSAYVLAGGLANTVAFKKNGYLFCRCIIEVTQDVYHDTSFQAGTIANWRAPMTVYASVGSNKGSYGSHAPLIISITSDGKIMVKCTAEGGEAAWGEYVCILMAPTLDGYE